MENWTKSTRKNLRFPFMVVAAALASASLLIKPVSFLSLVQLTRDLKDSFSSWMTAPVLFFLVNLIIIAILAMSRFNHNLDWTEHNHSHGGRAKETGLPNERGGSFNGRVKEIRLRNETGGQFEGKVKEIILPNEKGDLFEEGVKEISMPNGGDGQFHGRVREISMPNDRGDQFHGREREIGMPNGREDHFEARMKEISLPNETGEEEEEEEEEEPEMCTKSPKMCTKTPQMCTKLGCPGANGEERMLSGGRFASRRSSISKGKKMGQSLRVSHVEKDREETLESVWKKISEGRRPPLARHLRSGNGNGSGRLHKAEGTEESGLQMVLARGRSGGSAGQDELNKRAEAFIAKFNQDIKLQQQDSILGYADMIQRGAI